METAKNKKKQRLTSLFIVQVKPHMNFYRERAFTETGFCLCVCVHICLVGCFNEEKTRKITINSHFGLRRR